jgi:hypothetical protein
MENQVSWESSGWSNSARVVRRDQYIVGPCQREVRSRVEHVPDGLGEPASHLDAANLGPALAAEATLGALVVLGIDRVLGGMDRRLMNSRHCR